MKKFLWKFGPAMLPASTPFVLVAFALLYMAWREPGPLTGLEKFDLLVLGVIFCYGFYVAGAFVEYREQWLLRIKLAHELSDIREQFFLIVSGQCLDAPVDTAQALGHLRDVEYKLYAMESRPDRCKNLNGVRAAIRQEGARRLNTTAAGICSPEMLTPTLWRVEDKSAEKETVDVPLEDVCLPDGTLASHIKDERKTRDLLTEPPSKAT